ncbi:DNA-binding helix-turn-helix protein [Clostridium sp. MSTE9]|nr:DNA-binding helix-turn-helix protein [Clostridium sp. MSTE9]
MNSDDLTKAANLPRPTLNNVITGRNIRPATIGKVARALGVDVADLIESEV